MPNPLDPFDENDFADLTADLPDEAAPAEPAKPVEDKILPPAPAGDEDDLQLFLAGVNREREVPDPSKPWMKHHKFVLVETLAQVTEIVDNAIAAGKCSLDLEAEGLDNRINFDETGKPSTVHNIVGYCLSYDGVTGYYIPVKHRVIENETDPNVRPLMSVEAEIRRLCVASQPVIDPSDSDQMAGKKWLTPPQVIIGFWHAKFDQEYLLPITGIDYWHPDSFEDGYLASFTIYSDDGDLGLKGKSNERLRDPDGNPYEMIELKELFIRGRKIEFQELDPREAGVTKYACSDGVCTYKLCFEGDLITTAKSAKLSSIYRLEKQVSQVVRVMERNRVKIDKAEIMRVMEEAKAELAEYEHRIKAIAESKGFRDFNPGSTKQLSDFLFGEQGLDLKPKPGKNEKSGQYKTDAKSLQGIVDELPEDEAQDNVVVWVVKHRQIDKILGTYLTSMVNNCDKDDQLRFQFNQTGAATGRFSAPAGNPEHGYGGVPPQGIPSRSDPKRPKCANSLRRTFVARAGYTFGKFDYAGQELRVVTNLSGEPVWLKAFLEGSGDLHSITARAFFGKEEVTDEERGAGKRANFALVYGGGPQAIMRATGCNKIEGQRRKQAFDKAVPTFAKWVKNQHEKVAKELGVFTAFGRWLAIPDANSPEEKIRAACQRYSTNYPIQGSGADIMKISLVRLHKEFHKRGWLRIGGDDSVRMLMTVHDEVVFEIRHDLVPVVIPIIIEIMESPTFLAKPAWKVPLVVEPLLGLAWDGKYDWAKMRLGRKAKPGESPKEGKEYAIEDRIYQSVPPWLNGILAFEGGKLVGDASKIPPIPVAAPATPVAAPATPAPGSGAAAKPAGGNSAAAKPPVKESEVVTFCIETLTRNTVRLVSIVCMAARRVDDGKILCLQDVEGNTLIGANLGIRIDPEQFSKEMINRNLIVGLVSSN
jgi:DNA polymerase I-like protein with 3'-5' exonuclease and polymerase domains